MADKNTKTAGASIAADVAREAAARLWYVVDTNAQPDTFNGNILVPGARTHEQMIDGRKTAFKFEISKGVAMPAAIAIKFLRDPAFVRVDENGVEIPYERTPKQPEELGAGEKMVLKDSETIARYDELSGPALLQRVVTLPGGEKFGMGAEKPAREEMIAFIVAFKVANRKANTSREADRGRDEFVPPSEDTDDEMAA